ncbi:MAG: aminotransferase class I/II-fold pyridoxal phosphate-dependent enzyme [Planctomycetes bacterium]|nr:aminotransferase class I/II-fold pyridoxal phosphate-dependent enzyme [Planctomycetota bacterium]
MQRILVTGGAGYLGAILARVLLDRGHAVRCVDSLYFGQESIAELRANPRFELVHANIVEAAGKRELLEGIDAIAHLAGLANDPSCDLEPEMTELANFRATADLAESALASGIKRFVFAGSCSVYGTGSGLALDEDASLHPISLYARSKVGAERRLLELGRRGLEPVILRQATLFGVSPRMRFDLAINVMTLHACSRRRVYVLGGGEQWRPFLHVADAAEAFRLALEAPAEIVGGQIFNVGSDRENYQIRALAEMVVAAVPSAELSEAPGDADRRSYHVSFGKIARVLEWEPRRSARDGIEEVRDAIARGRFADFDDHRYYNVRTHRRNQETPVAEGGEPLRGAFLPFALPTLGEEEEQEVLAVLRSGWVTTGPRTQRFERQLADYTGAREVVAVNSCTAALHVALAALDIGPGDEVITTPITWPATANVVEHLGATPVFADIERDTFNIDPARIAEKITERTRAIVPVHMAGQPADLQQIHELAEARGIAVVEDAAHAIGAEYRGKRIGSISRFTCFSFYPIKNITTGEGGAIALNDPADSDRVRRLVLHGITRDAWKRYTNEGSLHWECVEPGYKYNMPDLAAALGIHQLPRLDGFIETRRRFARIYHQAFIDTPELILPRVADDVRHAHHLFIVMLRAEMLRVDRDGFVQALKKENIGTGIHFRGLHLQPFYRDKYRLEPHDYPNATFTSERIISLPLYPAMSESDVLVVANSVKKLVKYYRA